MLKNTLLHSYFRFTTNIPPPTQTNEHSGQQNNGRIQRKERRFHIRLDKINDVQYFMKIINEEHSLKQTNKMLTGMLKGAAGISKNNFQNIFRKYAYYIEKIPEKRQYKFANKEQKIAFLDKTTQIYISLGNLKTNHMTKVFNKVSDQIYGALIMELKDDNLSKSQTIIQMATTILSVSRYNKPKAISLFKNVQNRLSLSKNLSKINLVSAIVLMQMMSNTFIFNRLIVQTCIDVILPQISDLHYEQIKKILYCLASSQFPINRKFVLSIISRINRQFSKQIDHTSGQPHSKNQYSIRQQLRVLSSISMIQINMKLASAYLTELTPLYQVQLFDIGHKYLNKMTDKDLQKYCGFLRRACYYDESLLKALVIQLLRRNVKEINNQNEQNSDENRYKKQFSQTSLNTLCAGLHTLASYNYRDQAFVSYFVKLIKIIYEMSKTQTKIGQNNSELLLLGNQIQDEQQKLKGIQKTGLSQYISFKHYSRVVWAMCVIGNKQQIAEISPIFQQFFMLRIGSDSSLQNLPQTLNFYYCYLLLKTYLPKSSLSFQTLSQTLSQHQLTSSISLTHSNFYDTILASGVPALKQHNISNIMCDVFIPQYKSRNGKHAVNNVVLDVHGPHHFVRNDEVLKGNGVLREKILRSEGYVYHYVSVSEWELVEDKQEYVLMILDAVAEKEGKFAETGKIVQREESSTTNIDVKRRGGRKITTNSRKLSNQLNNK